MYSDLVDLEKGYILDINGWIYLHVEGEPYDRGFQHGYLIGPRIKESIEKISLWGRHDLQKDWDFFRATAEKYYVPKVPTEYKREIEGIVDGAKAKGTDVDYVDIVALNGWMDTGFSIDYFKAQEKAKSESSRSVGPEKCSAFIATGSWTKDGEIVVTQNSWWHYLVASHWNVILHSKPKNGHEMLMQSNAGFIFSGPDFYINSGGILLSSTTISKVVTMNPEGTPSFVRGRQAMQYADNIDDWVSTIMKDNNGGTPNTWNIGDAKTGEIACLELATYNHKLQRTKDGYFVGSNWALDPVIREKETKFDYLDTSSNAFARYIRWQQLMRLHKGEIDAEMAKKFMADHFDTSLNKESPSSCTMCGHVENDPRGIPESALGPYYPCGAYDGKVTTSKLALKGAAWFKWGKSCEMGFNAKQFLEAHPEYKWQEPLLEDIPSYPYALVRAYPWR